MEKIMLNNKNFKLKNLAFIFLILSTVMIKPMNMDNEVKKEAIKTDYSKNINANKFVDLYNIPQEKIPLLEKIIKDFSIQNIENLSSQIGQDDRVWTIILYVSMFINNFELSKYVIDNKIKNMIPNKEGCFPSHLAFMNGRINIANYMITKNPNILYDKNKNLETPLHLACYSGQVGLVKNILENKNYDTKRLTEIVDNNGITILHAACSCNPACNIITKKMASRKMFIVKYLVEDLKLDCNRKSKLGLTPFLLACANDFAEAVEYFVKKDLSCILTHKSNDGIDAIVVTCFKGSLESLKKICERIKHFNDSQFYDKDKINLLDLLTKKRHIKFIQIMVNINGVQVGKHQVELEKTPIEIAMSWGNPGIVNFLIDQGVDIKEIDKKIKFDGKFFGEQNIFSKIIYNNNPEIKYELTDINQNSFFDGFIQNPNSIASIIEKREMYAGNRIQNLAFNYVCNMDRNYGNDRDGANTKEMDKMDAFFRESINHCKSIIYASKRSKKIDNTKLSLSAIEFLRTVVNKAVVLDILNKISPTRIREVKKQNCESDAVKKPRLGNSNIGQDFKDSLPVELSASILSFF